MVDFAGKIGQEKRAITKAGGQTVGSYTDNMKKIVFYTNNLENGGAQRVLVNLANAFADNGYECVFVNSYKDKAYYELSDKVRFIALYDEKISGFIRRNFKYTTALRELLKTERPDVLLSFMPEPNFRAIIARRGLKTKTIISERCYPGAIYKSFFRRFFAKTLYKKADGIVFQTKEAMEWFSPAVRKKSTVIFNKVAERFFSARFDGERKDVYTAGRLTAQKNHALLIKAFARIADNVGDDLYIYGEGPMRGDLEALVDELGLKNRVFLPGNTDKIIEEAKSKRLFVMSSDFEGLPNALMEAMTLGIPCVSTDCAGGGASALITDNEDGIIVPTGDEKALADAMLKVLTNDALADVFGKNARQKAEKLFAPDAVFNEWESFLTDKVNGR